MARWQPQPDQPVGPNEHIGRRLFDEPMLAGAQDQPSFAGLDFRHFEETRDPEVSLDRLGQSGIDKAVVRYLRPRADKAGTTFRPPKAFNGWAVVRARLLSNPPHGPAVPVIASPIPGQGLDENIYHAHVATPDHFDHYSMALHLRHLFTSPGSSVYRIDSDPPTQP